MSRLTNKAIIGILIVTNIITAGFFILGNNEIKVDEKILTGSEQQNRTEYSYKENKVIFLNLITYCLQIYS